MTPWAVSCQTPLSMEFSRQEYWSGLPFPFPQDLPNPGIESRAPTLQADPLLSELPERSRKWYTMVKNTFGVLERNASSIMAPVLAGRFFTPEPAGKPFAQAPCLLPIPRLCILVPAQTLCQSLASESPSLGQPQPLPWGTDHSPLLGSVCSSEHFRLHPISQIQRLRPKRIRT